MAGNPGDPLGYDCDVQADMFADGRSCSGARLVGNAILHRLMADTLPLIGAPGGFVQYGANVRRWVGEVTTQALADAKGPQLVSVIARDPRVDPASIVVTITPQKKPGALWDLLIQVQAATTNQLPIALVMGVSSVTVQILSQGT